MNRTRPFLPYLAGGLAVAIWGATPAATAILARDVLVATNGYTDGAAPSLRRRIVPIGSYIIATEPLPADLAHEIAPTGRAFFDTKNFLSYWHVSVDRRLIFGGRVSFLPTTTDRTAKLLHTRMLEVHPQVAGHRIEYSWGGKVAMTLALARPELLRRLIVVDIAPVRYESGYDRLDSRGVLDARPVSSHWRAILALHEIQWQPKQLRWLWPQCQRQRHAVHLCMGRLLKQAWHALF